MPNLIPQETAVMKKTTITTNGKKSKKKNVIPLSSGGPSI